MRPGTRAAEVPKTGIDASWMLLAWLLALATSVGCQDPQQVRAQRAVARELEARRVRRAESMELYRQGRQACRARDLERAGELLGKAVGVDDRNVLAWMTLGLVHHERQRAYEAAEAFHRAARLEPTRYEPHFNLGIVLESAGRLGPAIDAYEKALALAPEEVAVMENLARCYIRADRDLGRAAELVEKALRSERRPEWRLWLQQQSARLADRKAGLE